MEEPETDCMCQRIRGRTLVSICKRLECLYACLLCKCLACAAAGLPRKQSSATIRGHMKWIQSRADLPRWLLSNVYRGKTPRPHHFLPPRSPSSCSETPTHQQRVDAAVWNEQQEMNGDAKCHFLPPVGSRRGLDADSSNGRKRLLNVKLRFYI